jgi:hypothetical protein
MSKMMIGLMIPVLIFPPIPDRVKQTRMVVLL